MKKIVFQLLIVVSWIYCLGYILFDFPTDHFVMRAVKGVLSIVFSCSLLLFLFHIIDNKKQKKEMIKAFNLRYRNGKLTVAPASIHRSFI